MEEVQKAAQADFEHISRVAKKEVKAPNCAAIADASWNIQVIDRVDTCDMFLLPQITRLRGERVEMLQQALVQLCEKQLLTAKESADQFNRQLQAFRGTA